jgi:preprotein translocase subunit SecD
VAPPKSSSGTHPGRALAALAVIILIMLIAITGKDTFSPTKWQQQFKVGLGLDLSSGTEVTLKAITSNGKPPSAGDMQQAISVLLSRVNGTGNSGAQVQQQGSDLINITVPGKPATSVIQLVSTTAELNFRQVYLEQFYTGTSTSASKPATKNGSTPSPSASSSASPSATPSASSPSPTTSSSATPKASADALSAKLASPSASATATPKASTSATPKASTSASPTASTSPSPSASPTSTASSATNYGNQTAVPAATMKLFNQMVCTPGPNADTPSDSWKSTIPGYSLQDAPWTDAGKWIVSCDASGTKYVLGPTIFEGKQITGVTAGLLQNTTQWVVDLSVDGPAAKAFGTVTTNQYNSYYTGYESGDEDDAVLDSTAMVLDGNVISAPVTNEPITAGQIQIQGPGTAGFTEAQATYLSNVLKYGSLPLQFEQQNVESISAQLGHNSLDAGLIAAIIGLSLVVIYSFIYYRGLGLVSVSSLLIAALLAYLSVVLLSRYQNFTMSLSAIAGLVVAIGITADSFIVFFERLRDEVREGKTLRPAVESGWKRARRTILVSDTVSFLAAVLLYHFAVSDVQGFAYTLGLTTLIDVLVVFTFTKPMVTLLAGTKFYGGGHPWSGLDPTRLGAKTLWRSSTRRTVRTQRTISGGRSTGSSPGTSGPRSSDTPPDSSSTTRES